MARSRRPRVLTVTLSMPGGRSGDSARAVSSVVCSAGWINPPPARGDSILRRRRAASSCCTRTHITTHAHAVSRRECTPRHGSDDSQRRRPPLRCRCLRPNQTTPRTPTASGHARGAGALVACPCRWPSRRPRVPPRRLRRTVARPASPKALRVTPPRRSASHQSTSRKRACTTTC